MKRTLSIEAAQKLIYSAFDKDTIKNKEVRLASKKAVVTTLVSLGYDEQWLEKEFASIMNAMFDEFGDIRASWKPIKSLDAYQTVDKDGNTALVTRSSYGYEWAVTDDCGLERDYGDELTAFEAMRKAERYLSLGDGKLGLREDGCLDTISRDTSYVPNFAGAYHQTEIKDFDFDSLRSAIHNDNKPVLEDDEPMLGTANGDESEHELFHRLCEVKRSFKESDKRNSYRIFSDKELLAMAHRHPSTEEKFAAAWNLSQTEMNLYGYTFFNTIQEFETSKRREKAMIAY